MSSASTPTAPVNPRVLLHLVAAVHFWYGCYYDWFYVKVPIEVSRMGETFGRSGKLKFLTYWDGLLQAVFFTVCLVDDLIGTSEAVPTTRPFTRRLRDTLLTCLAFPLSMFVGLTFWIIYAIDRELVLPRAVDPYFPTWLNHVMHTNIMLFILIEFVTTFRRYPSRQKGCTILAAFMVTYLTWMLIIYKFSGFWVYPILDVLNWPLRLVFFVSLLAMAQGLYFAGEKLNGVIWRQQLATVKQE